LLIVTARWCNALQQEMAVDVGRDDVMRVFDIYLTKIPAYEREIKKKTILEKKNSFLHTKN
jgi:hypothetical protein